VLLMLGFVSPWKQEDEAKLQAALSAATSS
jgi:hypothetical protein